MHFRLTFRPLAGSTLSSGQVRWGGGVLRCASQPAPGTIIIQSVLHYKFILWGISPLSDGVVRQPYGQRY